MSLEKLQSSVEEPIRAAVLWSTISGQECNLAWQSSSATSVNLKTQILSLDKDDYGDLDSFLE